MRLFESFMRNGEYVIFLNVFFHFIFIYFYFVGGDLQFLCVICIYWINIVHIFFCILESFFFIRLQGQQKVRMEGGGQEDADGGDHFEG